jgi:glucose-6-phosphate 1-dehydrogenase
MPAKDVFHDAVKNALIKDGWTITDDPYTLEWGYDNLFVDLGAERILAAEKESQKIAVEIKSFIGRSLASDLQKAIGQYVQYRSLLKRQDPIRVLWLAVPDEVFHEVFEGIKGKDLIADEN